LYIFSVGFTINCIVYNTLYIFSVGFTINCIVYNTLYIWVCFRLQAAKRLSYEMLCALSYLHSRKVTHRNLSLRNVLLDSYVSNLRVVFSLLKLSLSPLHTLHFTHYSRTRAHARVHTHAHPPSTWLCIRLCYKYR